MCVALSRARHGFYIVGNATLLASKSTLWKQIFDYLLREGLMGRHLALQGRPRRGGGRPRLTLVATEDDFKELEEEEERREGGAGDGDCGGENVSSDDPDDDDDDDDEQEEDEGEAAGK